ncbi:ABC transporter ATP-binding protein [Tenacibaculum litopenaei]|jgi:ABC-2 type transport system ATP-binding protein|uniref:ABC transporter ATP-binding protein n=1 Tax=Tenacibaculum litopenaei TaxID=396016 RepID=UPI003892E9C6
METILSIKNLHKNYGKIQAVNDLSFDIQKGNIYGILGPNGSGKSTTLGIILNVVNKTSGSFSWFNGTSTTHDALKKVGAIIERPNFYPYMTATQNLELICKIKGVSRENIDDKLKTVNLYERRHDKFQTYSLGMKQRLAIASALLNNPEILILDEPTNGLDPQGIHEIRKIIKKIAQGGTTILLASHLLDEVEKICTHVIVLRKGEKLYNGRVDTMIASNGIIEVKAAEDSSEENLINALKNYHETASVNKEDDLLIVQLENDISAATLNRYLFENNIAVAHLVKRKPSLEEQFLDLTRNN